MKLNEIMYWELSTLPAKLGLVRLQAYSDSGTVDQAFSLQQGGLSWPGLAAKHLGRLQKRNLVSSPWGPGVGGLCGTFLPSPLMVASGSHSSHQSLLAWTEPFSFGFFI